MCETKQVNLVTHLKALLKANSKITRRRCSYEGKLLQTQQICPDILSRMDNVDGNGRRMIGIWGTSGIGKTTIAKAIWNAIAHEFEGTCFLENVRENSPHGGLIQLQKTLLDKYLGKKLKIQSVDEGIGVIKEQLRHKKILLILDDVNRLDQLDNLAGVGWFGEGSRVIITTQDSGLLKCHGIEFIYGVHKVFDYQALELFSSNAFGTNEPPNDYLELAQRAIAFADGLPPALAILGSHLRGIDIRSWEENLIHILKRILQKSYDALDDRAKEYFLDIACFFKGEYEDYVLQMVPKKFIEEFVDKALITIEWSKILMHDLLANLVKDIVHKESPNDPGQRSRLWFYEDVKQVLTESTGTRNIKGIMVKLPEAEITLNPKCFSNMVNFQIFINRNASLCRHINYLPRALRFIDWGRCQLQSLPPNFQGNRLVEFNMSCSIRQLEGFKHLPNLTSMNLRDLSGIPNIKYLHLSECTSLVEVDDSVGFLDKLVELDLDGCVNLARNTSSMGCERLESFPEIEVKMESLWALYMQGSGIRELPPSIAYLTRLRELYLYGCFNLTTFSTTLRLKSLERLDLCDCKRLESFPEIKVEMESLHILDMEGSGIRELPPSIAYLTRLRELYLGGCFNLTSMKSGIKLELDPDVLQDDDSEQ
ncbi:Putative disease resistance TIR-NBS-LRR class protein [Prunus dulcis]|uniref:Disease resistance TIR-NBS-LRR class protein n=1 Tax=Prunus dulcis TaxID=3755 RepID=A0A5H2XR72_PRUDU|nr:Putative disease resistance TIR-NBS-LRR class protein [Prunus dulcis]